MILAPRYLPRLASTIGLFTNYGLRDFAKTQGLLSLQGAELATDGDASANEGQDKAVAFRKRLVELGPAYVKLGDEKPLGTASLRQVHSAALRDGREVVIKVQRPNLREQLSDRKRKRPD